VGDNRRVGGRGIFEFVVVVVVVATGKIEGDWDRSRGEKYWIMH
jgi:hypothetical protein